MRRAVYQMWQHAPADRGRDQRQSGAGGFGQRQAPAFPERREDEGIGHPVEPGDVRPRTRQDDVRPQAELADPAPMDRETECMAKAVNPEAANQSLEGQLADARREAAGSHEARIERGRQRHRVSM